MIIEIQYQGQVVGEMDLPEVKNMADLTFSARFKSSMDETAGKVDHWRRPQIHRVPKDHFRQVPHNKSILHDIPKGLRNNPNFLKSRAEKGEARPKAEYSNPAF